MNGKASSALEGVVFRSSHRARRITLRVSRLDGRVTVTFPANLSRREAERFLHDRRDWVEHALRRSIVPCEVEVGGVIPIQGKPVSILEGQGRSARLTADGLLAPRQGTAGAVRALLKSMARARAMARLESHAAELGVRFARLTLRDTRSRWGSCSSDGAIMLSWRLAMAPLPVFDYVVAHEAAHLLEMNHSAAFWQHVERLVPGCAEHRAWLRNEGPALHRHRFN